MGKESLEIDLLCVIKLVDFFRVYIVNVDCYWKVLVLGIVEIYSYNKCIRV